MLAARSPCARVLRHLTVSFTLVAVLLVAVLASASAGASADLSASDEARLMHHRVPESIEVLNEDNFDAYVFPTGRQAQAWFVLFYAPWCQHCKEVIPQFINASTMLENEIRHPHARFAVVNANACPELTNRFHVSAYPTAIYTTGKATNWHRFDGGRSTESFIEFAVYLQHAADTGSFADDVTNMHRFVAAEEESAGYRVPFYVFVPADSPFQRENQSAAPWATAVDGAASIGNVRFGVIYESDIDPRWREEGSSTYVEVIEAAKRCRREGQANGPSGEALISTTDRFRSPQCFSGPWLAKESEVVKLGKLLFRSPQRLSTLLEQFIAVNGFHAVEELNGGMFAILASQPLHFLGMLVVKGHIDQRDTSMLPVLRDMVQEGSKKLLETSKSVSSVLSAPQVTWTYIDGELYDVWASRYNIKEKDMPAVLLVDSARNRLFRAKTHAKEFEAIKSHVPWELGGRQQRILEGFVNDVLRGRHWGEKTTLVGAIAERLSYSAALSPLYRLLGYDDFTFVVATLAGTFLALVLLVALVVEPAMQRRTERAESAEHKRKLEKRKKAE